MLHYCTLPVRTQTHPSPCQQCIRFQCAAGDDRSWKTLSQPRKHPSEPRTITLLNTATTRNRWSPSRKDPYPQVMMRLSEILVRRFVSAQMRYATIRTLPTLRYDACVTILSGGLMFVPNGRVDLWVHRLCACVCGGGTSS